MEIARSVAAGFADLGILSAAAALDGLVLRPFAEDRLVVVAARQDDMAQMRQIRLADLAGRYFIGLSGSALQDHIAAQAAAMGMALRYRVRLRSFEAICHVAGAGAGIGIVPETAARRMKRTSGIAIIRLADGWARQRLAVCIRAGTELSVPAQSLFRHLTEARPQRDWARGLPPHRQSGARVRALAATVVEQGEMTDGLHL
ncbi:LysR substrate-binding domain-containing protein [Paracoccus aminovorans]|uniref:LysR substrate-binding domain-containing protein n=1 Tax=Paracoccus aminovorans TaxID=34004 RepID=UPI0031387B63